MTKTFSDTQVGNVAAGIMAISKNLPQSMSNQEKLATSKKIAVAILKSSARDLQGHTAVNNVILKQAGHEILSAVSNTWKGKGIQPPKRSENPGNSMGNDPAKDPPSPSSTYSKKYCSDKLTAAGVEDQSVIDEICAGWSGAEDLEPDTSVRDPAQKGAIVNANSNYYSPAAWLVAREQLFSGGNTAKRFEKEDKRISKGAAVIANSNEAPYWVKATSIEYRANNVPVSKLIKNASTMEDKRPAFIAGYLAKIHNK